MAPRTQRMEVRENDVRTEPVREPVKAKTRTRRGANADRYHVPQEMIPDGVDLQWVRESVLGQPDVSHRADQERQGWEPVLNGQWDNRFHDMFMGKNYKGEINIGGLVLMWRPLELTLEARAEEQESARLAINTHESKLRSGQIDGVSMEATQHPRARANTRLTKERVPSMAIPN